jgi:phage terminase small subunit
MLEKVHEEIMDGKLTTIKQGSKEQWYTEVNPLMPTYKELQRTMIQHYEALGLNYKSKPSNIKEPVAQGGEEHDKLNKLLNDIQNV